jgi:hypothetical protein
MKQFNPTAAAGNIITTSRASNLLWVLAFGLSAARMRSRLPSLLTRLHDFVDESVAAVIARCEQQATSFKVDDLGDRDLRDIGLYRDRFGLVLSEAGGCLHDLPRSHTSREACRRRG